ncbi:hypothetical protein ACFWQL_22340 [Amycolatopsis thermoflava]|uniref:hypothetical protein n=1 Tax=Amycolatopsis thermoflava TaxID=84480 RepID=UPI00366094D3
MSRSTTHDFYLGRGPDAEWIGSIHLGTCACHSVEQIWQAHAADEFTDLVNSFLHAAEVGQAGEVTHRGRPWPWTWPTSHGTDYTHAFDTGTVWTARQGQRWAIRAGEYTPPRPGETPVVYPHGRDTCGYTGIDAADTTRRRYGPLLGETHRHDLSQLGLRILADLTLPSPPGPAPAQLAELRAQLPPHLRYAITAHETTVELEIEVFGIHDGDLAADDVERALTGLPALYGWTDPDSGPPRFAVRVLLADEERHRTHPVLADQHTRALLTTT